MRTYVVEQDGEQILILPDELCEQLDLQVGDTMSFYIDSDGKTCFRKVDQRDWRYFAQ